ncbi:MAG: DUF4912 domain-containing protein [Clostridia bacterium]|nr:DUF4912 domain-containing protein [Clostridia bacterium]
MVLYWLFFRGVKSPARKPFTESSEAPNSQQDSLVPGNPKDVSEKSLWEISQEFTPVLREYQELPQTYGDNKMVVMAKDPYWLYTYWELSPQRWEELAHYFTTETLEQAQPVLRVYDVTDLDFNGNNSHSYFDQLINPLANNWYVFVPEPDRTYCLDLGRLLPGGVFITLLRSNPAAVPRVSISDVVDEAWPPIKEIYRVYGADSHEKNVTSPGR